MVKYNLSSDEHLRMQLSVMLPNKHSLYEYFCDLPLKTLGLYPKKGYRWWMGRAAKSPEALELRDYILYWRYVQLDVRKDFPREYLETLPNEMLQYHLNNFLCEIPLWAYEEPIKNIVEILRERDSQAQ